LDSLDTDALIRILTEPKNSLVKQYQTLFDIDGVQLEFEKEALEAIAKKALERKTGARGLRAIVEDATMDLMYHIPSQEDVTKCIITMDTVTSGAEPLIIRGEELPEYKGRVS
jgi:ATP-dependent Clp protease ATP-binding subunit ClpX